MSARLVLATHNPHKVSELRELLSDQVPGLATKEIVGAADVGAGEPVEDGDSFAANALLKARAIAAETGLLVIADDSGLEVDIMGGSPGIFSARWAGAHGDDRANLELLLAQMKDITLRDAQFTCAAVLVAPDGREHVEVAHMRGKLLTEPVGTGGFGYDPIFQAHGRDCSNAQLSPAEKNAISHRGKAIRALIPVLRQWL